MKSEKVKTKAMALVICLVFLMAGITNAMTEIDGASLEVSAELIIEEANEFIISKVGDDFFNNYIKLQSIEYQPSNEILKIPCYFMVYAFKIPEKTFVNEIIEILIDTDGDIIREYGIPNSPAECEFPVDEAKAMEIAKNAGLEEGLTDWETDFHWFAGDLKTYVWTVKNTLSASPTGEGYEVSGKVVVVDANSGEIKEFLHWAAMTASLPKPRGSTVCRETNIILYVLTGIIAMISLVIIIWMMKRKK